MTNDNYPADWPKRRRKVLNRDEFTCQNCSGDVAIDNTQAHVHHIKPISEGGGHSYDNLETLCKECHINQHSNGEPKDPIRIFECVYCNDPYVSSEEMFGSFCSKVCYSRYKAESMLNEINSNKRFCSSCHKPFGGDDVCKNCGNWDANRDCHNLEIDRVELLAYAYRIMEFGESWVDHEM